MCLTSRLLRGAEIKTESLKGFKITKRIEIAMVVPYVAHRCIQHKYVQVKHDYIYISKTYTHIHIYTLYVAV